MISKTLYVVHCIDTAGPLNETLDATFERLNKAFNLELKPSLKKLCELQNKKVNLRGAENAVADFLNPKLLKLLSRFFTKQLTKQTTIRV